LSNFCYRQNSYGGFLLEIDHLDMIRLSNVSTHLWTFSTKGCCWVVLTVPFSELFKFRSLLENQFLLCNFSEKIALVNSIPNYGFQISLHSLEIWDEERQPRLKVWSINIVYSKVTFLRFGVYNMYLRNTCLHFMVLNVNL